MTKISNQYSLTNVLFADAVNGRVGIGTASPTVALDVVGAGKFSSSLTASSLIRSGGTSAQYLMADGSVSTLTLTTTGTSGASTFSANTINIPNYGSALSGYLPLTGGTLTGALGGTSASFSGNLNAAQITASANIYISSAAPTLIFTNAAQSTTFGFLQHDGTNLALNNSINGVMTFATNNAEKMRILANGNIGINITSPNGYVATTSGLIHLNSSNTFAEIHLTNTSTGTTSADGLSLTQYFDQTIIMNNDNNAMLFGTNGSERMRITSGGNVGIGNTTPSTKLHVTGTVSSVELIMSGSGSFSYSTNSSWSSHQLIVPSGTLVPGGTYLIRIQWGSGDAPYIVYATGLWQPVQSNGGSADAEVALLCSSHQGVGTAIFIRNQSVGGQASSALYARLVNFPQLSGSITTTVSRLM